MLLGKVARLPKEEEIHDAPVSENWIGLKKFFKLHGITKEKQQEKVVKRLSKALKKDDARLANMNGKLRLNVDANYKDIL